MLGNLGPNAISTRAGLARKFDGSGTSTIKKISDQPESQFYKKRGNYGKIGVID